MRRNKKPEFGTEGARWKIGRKAGARVDNVGPWISSLDKVPRKAYNSTGSGYADKPETEMDLQKVQ